MIILLGTGTGTGTGAQKHGAAEAIVNEWQNSASKPQPQKMTDAEKREIDAILKEMMKDFVMPGKRYFYTI